MTIAPRDPKYHSVYRYGCPQSPSKYLYISQEIYDIQCQRLLLVTYFLKVGTRTSSDSPLEIYSKFVLTYQFCWFWSVVFRLENSQ